MASDQATTTGTPNEDDRDALVESGTAGTPQEDGRNAEPSGKTLTDDQWKEVLQWKAGAERAKELEAKLKEQESPQPPDVDEPPAGDGFDEWVKRGDPVARKLAAVERRIELEAQLSKMPVEEQDDVREHFKKNWWRLGDMKAARAELVASKYETEVAKLRAENEKLKRGPDPEVMNAPPTGGREVTARQRKTTMTEAQFDDRAAQIRQSQGELAYLKFLKENAGNIG